MILTRGVFVVLFVRLTNAFQAIVHPNELRLVDTKLGSSSVMFTKDHAVFETFGNKKQSWFTWNTRSVRDNILRDNDQSKVDEYLVFLDRRYNRLHGEEKQKLPTSWLNQNDDSYNSECLEEDSLCALGVSALASSKLRQKIRTEARAIKSSGDLSAVIAFGNTHSTPLHTILTAVGQIRSVFYIVALHRQQFVKKQSEKLKTVVAFLNNTWNFDKVRSAKAVWTVGGGRKNVAWTFTVMAALVLLLVEPLLKALRDEAVVVFGKAVL